MKKDKVAVVGSSGRMGTELLKLLREDDRLDYSAGVARSAVQHLDKTVSNMDALDPSTVDIVIDFSLPENTEKVLMWSLENKKPLVCGTTGVSEQTKSQMLKAGQKIPVLYSPNMSLGIAVLNKLISQLPKSENFDYQIEEFHHAQKKDRPSGTALFLQKSLETQLGKKISPIISVRGGGTFGIHKIYAMAQEEVITLEHTALNRAVFAKGAIVAAKWLVRQGPGYYEMSDVLGDL